MNYLKQIISSFCYPILDAPFVKSIFFIGIILNLCFSGNSFRKKVSVEVCYLH